jgi:hypothetical protein
MAGATRPIDVDNVLGVQKAMFARNFARPGLNSRGFNLFCLSAFPANQMVVVARRASSKKVLPFEGERVSAPLIS